mmetsp:Transcript_118257/g.341867  ORF Transcript_118257/g.341867 Transcript_118257/m.341867 type:complete len:412 (+) Transcript_118257:81-1316(+)
MGLSLSSGCCNSAGNGEAVVARGEVIDAGNPDERAAANRDSQTSLAVSLGRISVSGEHGPTPLNPFDEMGAGAVVESALEQARSMMTLREYNTLQAEEVLAQAIASLEARCAALEPLDDDETRRDRDEAARSLERLRSSELFQVVSDRVAQFDSAVEILYSSDMTTLFEGEYGTFDLCVSPDGSWFDYRIKVDVEAPLSEALATGHEMEYVPQAQPLVNDAAYIGEYSGFNLKFILRLAVLIFKSELVIEVVRHRDKRFGYVVEVARSEFPQVDEDIPKKAWGAIRPWVYNANLWMPRGDGKLGCTIVQVTRVDCTFSVPSWVLNFIFKKMSTTFINDLRSSAIKALNPESPWAKKIKEDKDGFYEELRRIEGAAQWRQEVRAKSVPDSGIFDRPWRLRPPLLDTRPPSSR